MAPLTEQQQQFADSLRRCPGCRGVGGSAAQPYRRHRPADPRTDPKAVATAAAHVKFRGRCSEQQRTSLGERSMRQRSPSAACSCRARRCAADNHQLSASDAAAAADDNTCRCAMTCRAADSDMFHDRFTTNGETLNSADSDGMFDVSGMPLDMCISGGEKARFKAALHEALRLVDRRMLQWSDALPLNVKLKVLESVSPEAKFVALRDEVLTLSAQIGTLKRQLQKMMGGGNAGEWYETSHDRRLGEVLRELSEAEAKLSLFEVSYATSVF